MKIETNEQAIRKKRYRLNTFFGLGNTAVAMVCGLILPRLILATFGSEVNGLINSITNLLGFIALFDMGIGATVMAALYRPIAEDDEYKINKIYSYATKFFRIIALIFSLYVVLLCVILPLRFREQFDIAYTIFLIAALSLTSLGQYFFGMVNSIFLRANQQGYVYYILQIVTTIANTIACYIEIKLGASIQVVKLTTSLIYLLRPLGLYLYVKKKYSYLKLVKSNHTILPEQWGGFTQHLSAWVLSNTDIFVLTLAGALTDISIYSVYYLITYTAIFQLINGLMSGHTALLGSYFANDDIEKVKQFYYSREIIIHNIATVILSVTGCLLVPFVMIYTRGVKDADYYQPIFSILMVVISFVYILRSFYYELIYSVGEFKKTQWWSLAEALINISLSLILVWKFGLIGIAIGTLVAIVFRTIYFLFYNNSKLGNKVFVSFLKNILCDLCICSITILIFNFIPFETENYLLWLLKGTIITFSSFLVCIIFNVIFHFSMVKNYFEKIRNRIKK